MKIVLLLSLLAVTACEPQSELGPLTAERGPMVPVPQLSATEADFSMSIEELTNERETLIAQLETELEGTESAATIKSVLASIRGEGQEMIVTTGSEVASALVARAYLLQALIDEKGETHEGGDPDAR